MIEGLGTRLAQVYIYMYMYQPHSHPFSVHYMYVTKNMCLRYMYNVTVTEHVLLHNAHDMVQHLQCIFIHSATNESQYCLLKTIIFAYHIW